MRASYWTASGAMAMPLGVSILALALLFKPNSFFLVLVWLAIAFIVAGLASFIAGWGYTIRDEHRKDVKEEEAKKQRQSDEKRRQREHRENLIMLAELANRRGMSTPRLIRLIERLEQEGEEEDGM